jgi:dTMP kinase
VGAAARAARRERTEDRARDAYEADDGLQKRTGEVYAELAAAAWLSPWSTVDDTVDPAALAARILR